MAVLSRSVSVDLSVSEDDSSYLEPGESKWDGPKKRKPRPRHLAAACGPLVVLDEVKPKFVKGAKRYGRRSRPDIEADAADACDSSPAPPSQAGKEGGASVSPGGVRQAKLRRSTSLESVEVRSRKSQDRTNTDSTKSAAVTRVFGLLVRWDSVLMHLSLECTLPRTLTLNWTADCVSIIRGGPGATVC